MADWLRVRNKANAAKSKERMTFSTAQQPGPAATRPQRFRVGTGFHEAQVVRSLGWRDPGPAGVLDPELLPEHRDFRSEPIIVRRETDATDAAVGAPAADERDATVSEGDGKEQARLGLLGPVFGQRNGGQSKGHPSVDGMAAVEGKRSTREPTRERKSGEIRLERSSILTDNLRASADPKGGGVRGAWSLKTGRMPRSYRANRA
jgi:hypothetical protein